MQDLMRCPRGGSGFSGEESAPILGRRIRARQPGSSQRGPTDSKEDFTLPGVLRLGGIVCHVLLATTPPPGHEKRVGFL